MPLKPPSMSSVESLKLAIANMQPAQRIEILNYVFNYRMESEDKHWEKFFESYEPEQALSVPQDKVKIRLIQMLKYGDEIAEMAPVERLEVVKEVLKHGSDVELRHWLEVLYEGAYTDPLRTFDRIIKNRDPNVKSAWAERSQKRELVCFFAGETTGLQEGPCNACRTKRFICICESPFRVHLGPLLDDLASMGKESLARKVESTQVNCPEDLVVVWYLLRNIDNPKIRISRLQEYLIKKVTPFQAMGKLLERLPVEEHDTVPSFIKVYQSPYHFSHQRQPIASSDKDYPDVEVASGKYFSYKKVKGAFDRKRETWQPLLTNTILDSTQPGGGSECLYIGDPSRGWKYQTVQINDEKIAFPRLALILDYHENGRRFNFQHQCRHLCGNEWCANLRHLILELANANKSRSRCMADGLGKTFCNGCGAKAGRCEHTPECLKFGLIPSCSLCSCETSDR